MARLALADTELLRSLLYGVALREAATLAVLTALFLEVCAAASLLAARPVPLRRQRPAGACCTTAPVSTMLPVVSTPNPPSGMAGPPWSRK